MPVYNNKISDGIFYVREFGARGDGTVNDLPAIKRALAAAYAFAQHYSSGSLTGSTSSAGCRVKLGPGIFYCSGSLDLTFGDPFGSGSGYEGWGRVSLEGDGRRNTRLIFDNGTAQDAITVGSYTKISDVSITGQAKSAIRAVTISGTAFSGRSGERLQLTNVYCDLLPDIASGEVAINLPAIYFATLNNVFSQYGTSMGQGPTGNNSYDTILINCELTNLSQPTAPALLLHGSGFNIQGGIIYSQNSSSALVLEEGSMTVNATDFAYTAVNSTTGYDITVGNGTSGSAIATIIGSTFPSRSVSFGTSGNVFVRANASGGFLGSCIYLGAPSVHIESGATNFSILDPSFPAGGVNYNNSASLFTYTGYLQLSGFSNYVTGTVSGALGQFNSLTSSNDALIRGRKIGRGSTTGHSTTLVIGSGSYSGSGTDNLVIGDGAYVSGTNIQNVAIGNGALRDGATSRDTIAIGVASAISIQTGSYNVAVGAFTLGGQFYATQGTGSGLEQNVAIGWAAMGSTPFADRNVAIGVEAMRYISGNRNIAIGVEAGRYLPSNANNTASIQSIFLGGFTRPLDNGQTNQIVIGYNAFGSGSNTTVIGNSSTISTTLAGVVSASAFSASTYYGLDIFASGVLEKNFLLTAEPYIANNYSVTYSGSTAVTESWVNSANSREIKRIVYAYTTGTLETEVVSVFSPADGTTIIAQTTASYVYSSGRLTAVTKSRSV